MRKKAIAMPSFETAVEQYRTRVSLVVPILEVLRRGSRW